jgi:hypothetical protein
LLSGIELFARKVSCILHEKSFSCFGHERKYNILVSIRVDQKGTPFSARVEASLN